MSDHAPRSRPYLLAVAVLCCGGFVVGIWEPLADALDRHFPSREVVAEPGSRAESWQIELDRPDDDSEHVREALLSVPEGFAQRIAAFGGRIVFTHSERLKRLGTVDEHSLLHAAGIYHPASRTAYISTDGEEASQTGLHEIGHMLDHALGDLSAEPDVRAICRHAAEHALLNPYALSNPRECFADIFERYYYSDRRRRTLADRLPEATDYLRALERKVEPR